jgi:hypothetical protein
MAVIVAVVYVCPVARLGAQHFDYAARFVATWLQNPPEYAHSLFVVSNGGPPDAQTRALFALLNANFIEHDDSGFDIGAYQCAARQVQADLMVFLGGSTYLRGPGWLNRAVSAFLKHGQGLYGVMGHTGDMRFNVQPHIRTTGFWMPPALMNRYPTVVRTPEARYPFEHGPNCLTTWVERQNLRAWVVTWTDEYKMPEWGTIPNGYHVGDQSAMLMGDRLSEPPYHPCP